MLEHCLHHARECGNNFLEATALIQMASLKRRTEADLTEAEVCAKKAHDFFYDSENWPCCIEALCEIGHIALAKGESAASVIDQTNDMLSELEIILEENLHECLLALKKAQETFTAGLPSPLFRGELLKNIPTALLDWLIFEGQYTPETDENLDEKKQDSSNIDL